MSGPSLVYLASPRGEQINSGHFPLCKNNNNIQFFQITRKECFFKLTLLFKMSNFLRKLKKKNFFKKWSLAAMKGTKVPRQLDRGRKV